MKDRYNWHTHQQAMKNIALQLCIDVEIGKRNSITFEVSK